MSQSPRLSLIESGVGTGLAVAANMTAAAWLFPLFGIELPLAANVQITAVMTALNMALRYGVRRAFNRMET